MPYRRLDRESFWVGTAVFAGITLVLLVHLGWVTYVALHFIVKFW